MTLAQMRIKRRRVKRRLNILTALIMLLVPAIAVLIATSTKPGRSEPGLHTVTPSGGTNEGDKPSIPKDGYVTVVPAVSQIPDATPAATSVPVSTPALTPVTDSMSATARSDGTGNMRENPEALKKDLEAFISEQDGRYGVYYINLVTGEEFGINDRDEYIAASTAKLPMNLLLYKKIASGEVDPDSKLTYIEEDFEAGTGIIQESPFGTEYTVRETARLSIVHSDNCGINMIIRLLGIDNIRKYMQDLGGTVYYGSSHRTCPYDLALYAAELYRFYLESPEIAGVLIEDLQNTEWNDRINKFLPADVKVSHKIGTFTNVYNDVGIVFASEPYVVAIMSEDIEHEVASDVIGEISKRIYDFVENQAVRR